MDPYSGHIYSSIEAAQLAGVAEPVEIIGPPEAVESISAAVAAQWTREQKATRNAKNKAARAARRRNRT